MGTSRPLAAIIRRARSAIATGSPGSGTSTPRAPSLSTASASNATTSCSVKKYRRAAGCVTVTGPPRAICSANSGATLPGDPITFTSRTAVVPGCASMANSAIRFDAPMMLCGATALSVEMRIILRTPYSAAIRASRHVPTAFVSTAANGFRSISGRASAPPHAAPSPADAAQRPPTATRNRTRFPAPAPSARLTSRRHLPIQSNSACSAISRARSLARPKPRKARHLRPINPPAPVTSTRRPATPGIRIGRSTVVSRPRIPAHERSQPERAGRREIRSSPAKL